MRGNGTVTFAQLFEDTVREHGSDWALRHYTRNGMQEWEFWFWVSAVGVAA